MNCSIRALDRTQRLAVLVDDQGGDHFDLLPLGQLRLVVDVHLAYRKDIPVLLSDFVQRRDDPPAVYAPGCPKFHQDRLAALQMLRK